MLYYLFAVMYVLACFLLLLVVLLQQGKGGDMASAFGGGGSQTAFGARAGATVLTKATAVLGALFMLGAIGLGIMGQRGPGSLMRGLGAPVSAPINLPAQTGPVPAAPTTTGAGAVPAAPTTKGGGPVPAAPTTTGAPAPAAPQPKK
jgi:preprotein translocase subunit SecG